MLVKPGEIYWAQFSPVKGSEQSGIRPALIVQHDLGNQYSPTTVVVPLTQTIPPKHYPFVVIVEAEESGLPYRSAVNCAQIVTIQKDEPGSRLLPPKGETKVRAIGRLRPDKMDEVSAALRYNLGLNQ